MNSAVIRVIFAVVVAVGALGGTTALAQDSRSQAEYVSRARSGTQGEVACFRGGAFGQRERRRVRCAAC